MSGDPFGTAALRHAVRTAWAASPARLREDANAEEDLVRGGYRGRWFTELAQNAADAGAAAGRPARLRVRLHDGELRVGNTGAPLDADGVVALASLRASAKRGGGTVGRFGVGFSAVLDLTDEPRVVSTGGGVAFSRARTREEVMAAGGALAAEAERRGPDGVPALRLPWPVAEDLDPDVVTEVRLPLRDPAVDVLRSAREQAPDLLLALPWLAAVEVAGETVERVEGDDGRVRIADVTWTVLPIAGELPPDLRRSAALAVEDRGRTGWEGLWAYPAPGPDTLHAPTATAETTTLPARLVVTVPLDADRRRVRRGPVTDHVLRAAAARYPDLVRRVDPAERTALVPDAALPASEVDAVLREGALAALRRAAWLPGAAGPDVVPARASALPDPAPALVAALADTLDGLTDRPWTAALGDLGVARLDPAALVDRLTGLRRPPSWWRALYAALAALEGLDRTELAALPVPLVDGRLALGPRGRLLPGPELADLDLEGLDLHVVHPDAVHPLLEALGARRADGPALLDEPEVREAVERSVDDADAGLDVDPLARLVLAVITPGTAGFGALALPEHDGGYRRADELVLPDGALRAVLGEDSPVGVLADRAAAAYPRAALLAVGVLDGFAVLHDDAPTGPDHDLDEEETWWAEEVDPEPGRGGAGTAEADGAPTPPSSLVAVRDLELVADWAAAWPVLAADREVRAALVRLPGEPVPYTAWWLARHGRLTGRRPGAWRLPGAVVDAALEALYDPAPVDLDAGFLTAVGVRTDLRVAGPAEADDLLARLADPARVVPAAAALAAHTALGEAVHARRLDVADVDPPDRVRTAGGAVVTADPDRDPTPVVLDRPWLLGAVAASCVVPVAARHAAALAELLDLPVASEVVHGEVRSPGTATAWSALVDAAVWAAAAGRELPDGEVVVHERLRVAVTVDGATREIFPVVWVADGTLHTDDPVRALLA
ncbi:sacsin N-terminal ATP-binding-like domain-containing protein [Actinomycetospora sp. CA-084318]|uniref:sacsin N-terminal ATP-binding-like domain-containing protein n=1 Tax=Actinomycetospora sp. CA-084318 TaxID=3239892 RepID=UPI003D98A7B8